MAIRGTDRWRCLGRWQIAIGKPIALDDLRGTDPGDAAREATMRVWNGVNDLLIG